MKLNILTFVAAAAFGGAACGAPLKIVATTSDLADIARLVAGGMAEVSSICTGREDPHHLLAKPGFILRARDADLWIRVGMELETGWEPVILRESRNRGIRVGEPGHLDASRHVLRLEVPAQPVTRDLGDVHPAGNPHYWLDPLNGRLVAAEIAERLIALRPESAAACRANLAAFERDLDTRMFGVAAVKAVGGEALWKAAQAGRLAGVPGVGGWFAALAPHRGKTIVTYHRSWSYLANRFGLKADLQLEPKPGVPPSARHLTELAATAKARHATVILQAPFYSRSAADFLAARTGAKVLVVPMMTGGGPGAATYLDLLDQAVAKLAGAL